MIIQEKTSKTADPYEGYSRGPCYDVPTKFLKAPYFAETGWNFSSDESRIAETGERQTKDSRYSVKRRQEIWNFGVFYIDILNALFK